MMTLIKKLLESKWLSRKLAVALAALTPAILRATGVEVSSDTWVQVAELIVGGAVAVGYLLTQGAVDKVESHGEMARQVQLAKTAESLANTMGAANSNAAIKEKASDALASILKS